MHERRTAPRNPTDPPRSRAGNRAGSAAKLGAMPTALASAWIRRVRCADLLVPREQLALSGTRPLHSPECSDLHFSFLNCLRRRKAPKAMASRRDSAPHARRRTKCEALQPPAATWSKQRKTNPAAKAALVGSVERSETHLSATRATATSQRCGAPARPAAARKPAGTYRVIQRARKCSKDRRNLRQSRRSKRRVQLPPPPFRSPLERRASPRGDAIPLDNIPPDTS